MVPSPTAVPPPVRLQEYSATQPEAGSVYVHAPFCARRCFYCDFAVTESSTGEPESWSEALALDLERVELEGHFKLGEELSTLFVGGGTPSILGSRAMAAVVKIIGPGRLGHPKLEWTAEANPESFTEEVAHAWAQAGVNRVSFGTQSFQPSVLAWLRRLHGPEGSRRAVASARAAGIENISLDLMFGLPDAVSRDWGGDLRNVIDLDVPHVSLYGLTVEEGTPLHRAVAEGSVPSPRPERYAREYLEACRTLGGAGYRQYEVGNFARPGAECRHNQVYWNREPYTGLGNGAHSFRHPRRRWNLRSWTDYQRALAAGKDPWEDGEVVTPDKARMERIWLGLRTWRGLWFPDLSSRGQEVAGRWVDEGLARVTKERLSLTPEGWLLLDHLVLELDGVQE